MVLTGAESATGDPMVEFPMRAQGWSHTIRAMGPTKGASDSGAHRWEFRARLRRGAFGWRSSQLAVRRVKEAVGEVKKVARSDPAHAADGAVLLIERLSPALEHVDSSSGALGTAVNHAINELVPIISMVDVDTKTRQRWLERLWAAHAADQMPYIESLADYWGELCGSRQLASGWADQLMEATRTALSPDPSLHAFFHGTTACLSALYRSERYEEIVDLFEGDAIWPYKRWAVKALVAMGKKSEAIRYAEASRGPWTNEGDVDAVCEEILLSSGLVEEAYRRYGVRANRCATYLATFRATAKKYPDKPSNQLLTDLVRASPGKEAKWFAAAKDAGLYEEALALAGSGPCDPKTLTRAARDFAVTQPDFARAAGMLALRWLVEGYGYEITSTDVWDAYTNVMAVAKELGNTDETQVEIAQLVAGEPPPAFVGHVLGRELER